MFMTKLRNRVSRQEGFTLIELLVVLVIIGVLLAIAVPSYLGFKKRAEQNAAASNMRAAIPSVEAFYSDFNTYDGISTTILKADYDAGISNHVEVIGSGATYTISFDNGACTVAAQPGPGPDLATKTLKDAGAFGGTCTP